MVSGVKKLVKKQKKVKESQVKIKQVMASEQVMNEGIIRAVAGPLE